MLTKDEQETTVLIETTGRVAKVYTSDPSRMKKFDKLCNDYPDDWKCTDIAKVKGEIVGKSYECKKQLISFRSHRKHPNISDEHRIALSENMKRLNQMYT